MAQSPRADRLPGMPTDSAGASRAIDVVGAAKWFIRRDVQALASVDLQLGHGEFGALIGPSGCGKSTLLNLVSGLVEPTEGQVRVFGEDVRGPRRDVGMMFQAPSLLPWRTTLDNVLLPVELAFGKRASKDRRDKARDLLEVTGLEDFAEALPGELSGGMQQRAAICRMLIMEPKLLLLDEPFGALDEMTRERMNLELKRITRTRQATALMVTHSISEAVFLADYVFVMSGRPGRIIERIDVDLPQERDVDTLTSGEFLAMEKRVRSALAMGADQ